MVLVPFFPSSVSEFNKVYTPRGRQTLCEEAPPDVTYNDKVRRIRAADNYDKLKVLVERQFHLTSNQKQRPKTTERASKQRSYIRKQQNEHGRKVVKAVAWVDDQLRQDKNGKRKGLHNLYYSNENGCQAIFADINSGNDSNDDKFEYYLRLATNFYVQGFLSNIRYLRSIGERNDTQLKRQQQRPHAETSSRIVSASSTTSTNCQTPRAAFAIDEDCFKLTTLLKSIGRKHSFKIGTFNNNFPKEKTNTTTKTDKNWAIRVNITPSTGSGQYSSTESVQNGRTSKEHPINTNKPDSEEEKKTKPNNKLQHSIDRSLRIMNNFLNSSKTQNSNTFSSNNSAPAAAGATLPLHHCDSLVDNLTQLDLDDINSSLPKIILTDCSTKIKRQSDSHRKSQGRVQQKTVASELKFDVNAQASVCHDFNSFETRVTATGLLKKSRFDKNVTTNYCDQDFNKAQNNHSGTIP